MKEVLLFYVAFLNIVCAKQGLPISLSLIFLSNAWGSPLELKEHLNAPLRCTQKLD